MSTTTQQGQDAENLACDYLQAQGLHLLERNYRLRSGEIDIVCRDGTHLVFIEVRYRKNERYGGAVQSIDWRKQQRIIRTAQHYLLRHRVDLPVRFDVVAISGTQGIEWIQDAFRVE